MAIHLASLKPSPLIAATAKPRTAPLPAARANNQQVQRPESGTQPSFRTLALAASASAQTAPSQAASATNNAEAMLQALFPGTTTHASTSAASASTTPSTPASTVAPTAESVFGNNPWVSNPTGTAPDGSTYGYNQQYFATPQTAAEVAQMVGGTVVQANEMCNAPGSTFQQQQPNEMVQLKDGTLINPGLVAGFYTHGYPQATVDQMVANEVANS